MGEGLSLADLSENLTLRAEGRMGCNGCRVLLPSDGNVLEQTWWLCNIENVPNATESFILKSEFYVM